MFEIELTSDIGSKQNTEVLFQIDRGVELDLRGSKNMKISNRYKIKVQS